MDGWAVGRKSPGDFILRAPAVLITKYKTILPKIREVCEGIKNCNTLPLKVWAGCGEVLWVKISRSKPRRFIWQLAYLKSGRLGETAEHAEGNSFSESLQMWKYSSN